MALQALAEFTKQPGEDFPIAIEFANRLPSGASLVSGTATGRNANTLEVAGAPISNKSRAAAVVSVIDASVPSFSTCSWHLMG